MFFLTCSFLCAQDGTDGGFNLLGISVVGFWACVSIRGENTGLAAAGSFI